MKLYSIWMLLILVIIIILVFLFLRYKNNEYLKGQSENGSGAEFKGIDNTDGVSGNHINISEREFGDLFMDKISKHSSIITADRESDLDFIIYIRGKKQGTASLANIYKKERYLEGDLHDNLNRFITFLLNQSNNTGANDGVIVGEMIYPVVKPFEYMDNVEYGKESILYKDIGSDLIQIFAIDDEDHVSFLNKKELSNLQLSGDTIENIAIKNLDTYVSKKNIEVHDRKKGFLFVKLDSMYESSFIFSDKIVSGLVKNSSLQSSKNIAFAIPSRDNFYIIDLDNSQGVKEVKDHVEEIYNERNYSITDKLLKKNNDGTLRILNWFDYIK